MMPSNHVPAADSLRDLLKAVADPAGTQARIDAIAIAEKRLGDLEARAAQLDLDRRQHEEAKAKWVRDRAAEQASLDKRSEALSEREGKHNAAAEQHRAAVLAHERAVDAFARERARHAGEIAAVQRLRDALG